MSALGFQYGTRRIEFRLVRKEVRTLAITVQADGKVRAVAPLHAQDDQVIARVRKRARWIVQQWERQASYLPQPRPRPHHSGTSIRYMGRQCRVRVTTRSGDHEPVALHRTVLEVRATNRKDEKEINLLIQNWFRTRAEHVLAARFQRCLENAARHRLKTPKMRLRSMPKRWGSALKNGTIHLNPELIKAPSACIDYVITHEICHLKHPDHGPKFRALLQQLCPDWKRLKERLERAEG